MAKKDTVRLRATAFQESVELPGKIISAAKSTFAEHSFEKGYPEAPGRLRMDNLGKRK